MPKIKLKNPRSLGIEWKGVSVKPGQVVDVTDEQAEFLKAVWGKELEVLAGDFDGS